MQFFHIKRYKRMIFFLFIVSYNEITCAINIDLLEIYNQITNIEWENKWL